MKIRLRILCNVILTIALFSCLVDARQGSQVRLTSQANDIVHDLIAEEEQRDAVKELMAEAASESVNDGPQNDEVTPEGISDAADESMMPPGFSVVIADEGEDNLDERSKLAIEAPSDSMDHAIPYARGKADTNAVSLSRPTTNNRASSNGDGIVVLESTDYARSRLAALEDENKKLRQRIAQSDEDKDSLKAQVLKDKTQLQQIPQLQGDVRRITNAKHREDALLLAEQEREQKLTLKMYNVTQFATRESQDLESTQSRATYLQEENSAMLALVKKANAENKALKGKIAATDQSGRALSDSIRKLRLQVQRENNAVNAAQSKVDKLVSDKAEEEERAEAAEHAVQIERQRKEASESAMINLRKSLHNKTNQLQEEQLREQKMASDFEQLASLLNATRANATNNEHRVEKLKANKRILRKKITALKQLMENSDEARQRALAELRNRDNSRKRNEAELEQLRGSVPMLQAKVADDENKLRNVSTQMRRAKEERDAAKAMLTQTRHKVTELETQYATVVQELASLDHKSADGADAVEPPLFEDLPVP